MAAAGAGDREAAQQYATRLADMDGATVWRAYIAAALGDREQAVELLREAFDQGGTGFMGGWHRTGQLQPLRDYPPYQEFMRPKG